MKKVYEGLAILLQYDPDGYFAAEHDEVFAGEAPPHRMQLEDIINLDRLGWRWDPSLPAWRKFV